MSEMDFDLVEYVKYVCEHLNPVPEEIKDYLAACIERYNVYAVGKENLLKISAKDPTLLNKLIMITEKHAYKTYEKIAEKLGDQILNRLFKEYSQSKDNA